MIRSSWQTRLQLCAVIAVSASLVSCQRNSPPQPVPEEVYSPGEGAVGLDIMRAGGAEGPQRWLATYSDGSGTTRFSIELDPVASSADAGSPSTGKGRFLAENGSNPIPLLDSLKKALQAKHMPRNVQKADVLEFNYLLIGDNRSRSPSGSFQPSPRGNWRTLKLFLANDQAEVYFSFNQAIHKAEFSIKDAGFGDRVVAELARVL